MPTVPQPQTQPPSPLLVEVLDQHRRTVAVLPAAEAARQKLPHRTIAVLLYDEQARLVLRRIHGGRWDLFVRGPVQAGEAISDASRRILEAETGIHLERLRPLADLPAQPENGNEFLHLFSHVLRGEAVSALHTAQAEDYSFTPEELDCLLRDFRELVSPRLLYLSERLSVSRPLRRRP